MTKGDDEIVAYTKSGTPIKAKYMRRLLDYREVDNIKQELAKAKREAYTQGRVDEAKTCEGCKEDTGKVIAEAKEERTREIVSTIKPNKDTHEDTAGVLNMVCMVLRSKFLNSKDD